MKSSASSGMKLTSEVRFAAIYARVSTEDQGKGFSIPTQIDACRQLAKCEGYTVPEAYVLIDEGISGTIMHRPALRRLRDLVDARAITAIMVYDPDRLSRNLGHQLLLAEECERAGVKLLIVSHPMEQGPEGWLFFQMRGALAEYERAKILERMKRGLVGRAKAGHVSGGGVAFGYRYIREDHGGRWEIDEDEAAVVRRIFRLCLEGMPTRAIARLLTRERVPSKHDRHPALSGRKAAGVGEWHANTIHGLLRYEGYIGRIYYNKQKAAGKTRRTDRPRDEWVPVDVPAIIEAEVSRQQAGTDEQRAEILQEISHIEDTLAKCDREEQRWAQAYVAEVINLEELKGYRNEIAMRRQQLVARRHDLQTNLDHIGHALEQVEASMGYCERVHQRLQTFLTFPLYDHREHSCGLQTEVP
jgi:site-specific DNA recombinase